VGKRQRSGDPVARGLEDDLLVAEVHAGRR
jgi:hypothetical protein